MGLKEVESMLSRVIAQMSLGGAFNKATMESIIQLDIYEQRRAQLVLGAFSSQAPSILRDNPDIPPDALAGGETTSDA